MAVRVIDGAQPGHGVLEFDHAPSGDELVFAVRSLGFASGLFLDAAALPAVGPLDPITRGGTPTQTQSWSAEVDSVGSAAAPGATEPLSPNAPSPETSPRPNSNPARLHFAPASDFSSSD